MIRGAKLQIKRVSAYNDQMINFKYGVILALFLSAATLTACVSGTRNENLPPSTSVANTATANANSAKTNVEELGLLVNVPYLTEDIVWKEDAAKKKIIAVMRFSTADANKIVAEAEKNGAAQTVEIAVENWFPDELTAQGEMSGDNALKGLAYSANAFFLEPYTAGRITRIEGGDYFVLELSAK